jgi:hypothetical protein
MNLSMADLRNYCHILCRVLAAILKMADISKILKMQNCSSNGDLSLCQILCLYHYPFRSYQHYSRLSFFPWTMNLSTADLGNYWTEFHETWWSYRYMFLVGPKVFSVVVKGVKVIFWGVRRGWGLKTMSLQMLFGRLNYLWWPCLLTDQNGMSNSHRGSSIDASYHVSE